MLKFQKLGSSGSFYTRDLIMKKFLLDLDCMATRLYRLTDRYFSLAREEEAEGKTLFAQRLGNEIHWLHPHPDSY